MSTTWGHSVVDVAAHTDYLMLGLDDRREEHLANGTDRLACMRSSRGSIKDFVRYAEQMAALYGRRVQAYVITQSFHPDEFDVTSEDDIRYIGELGVELAQRLHPNTDFLVVTHADSEGKNGHNHIVFVNHDDETGQALSKNRLHSEIKWHNDQLMREHGLRVVEKARRPQTQRDYWLRKSGEVAPEATTFDEWLRQELSAAMFAPSVQNYDDFVDELDRRGIDVVERHGDAGDVGLTYKAMDTFSDKPRPRRRKASKLGDDFTHEHLSAMLPVRDEVLRLRAMRDPEDRVHEQFDGEYPVMSGDIRRELRDLQDEVLPEAEPIVFNLSGARAPSAWAPEPELTDEEKLEDYKRRKPYFFMAPGLEEINEPEVIVETVEPEPEPVETEESAAVEPDDNGEMDSAPTSSSSTPESDSTGKRGYKRNFRPKGALPVLSEGTPRAFTPPPSSETEDEKKKRKYEE